MDKEMLDRIPKNIKKLRLQNNMTQADVVAALNLDTQYYAQLERGERNFTVEKLIMLCSILKADINNIIDIQTETSAASQETLDRIGDLLSALTESQLRLLERIINDIITCT